MEFLESKCSSLSADLSAIKMTNEQSINVDTSSGLDVSFSGRSYQREGDMATLAGKREAGIHQRNTVNKTVSRSRTSFPDQSNRFQNWPT